LQITKIVTPIKIKYKGYAIKFLKKQKIIFYILNINRIFIYKPSHLITAFRIEISKKKVLRRFMIHHIASNTN